MNKWQMIILWVGVLILSGIWLFPPWTDYVQAMDPTFHHSVNLPAYTMNTYYHFAFGSPEGWHLGLVMCVDWGKLLLSSVPVVLLTATAILTARTKKQ